MELKMIPQNSLKGIPGINLTFWIKEKSREKKKALGYKTFTGK